MNVIRPVRRPSTPRRGFTIIELLIVIGIILAIGALVLVNVSGASDKADLKLARVQIQAFNQALEQFKVDMKRFPTEDEGLAVLWNKELVEDEDEMGKWAGPYLKAPSVKDTWGNEWLYRNPSEIEGVAYDIVSVGPDKEEGTDDDITSNDGMVGEDGETLDEFSDFSSNGG